MTPGVRRLLSSTVMIAILLAGGLMIAGWLFSTKPSAERTGEPPLPLLVRVRAVSPADKQEFFTGYGTARAEVDALLACEVRGRVVEIAEGLDEGVHVAKGQILVRIDDRQYQQQLLRADALAADLTAQMRQLDVEKANIARLIAISDQELEVNRNEMNRLAGLFEKELASKKEYDFARLAYQQSRRQLVAYKNQVDLIGPRREVLAALHQARLADAELAKLDIERCRITAPFEGEVVKVSVDVGDHVMLGGEIARLISTRIIEIPIELPASIRRKIAVGASCRLVADTMDELHWEGRIARIAPLADTQSRTFAAYVEVDNETQRIPLVPGVFLTARVEGPILEQVLAVPRGALVGDSVFVVNDDRVHARSIHVDRLIDEWAVVSGDLRPGDRVVVTNLDVLVDGTPVRVEIQPTPSDPMNQANEVEKGRSKVSSIEGER